MDKVNGGMSTEEQDIIINKFGKKIGSELVITDIFDEETGEYTTKGVEVENAILQGEASGRYRMAVELGFKALDMLKLIQLETGVTIEELMYLKKKQRRYGLEDRN
jgi:hypothetical protein